MCSKPSQKPVPNSEPGTVKRAVTFYPVPGAGALSITGSDRIDFLQRQTTNDLGLLSDDTPVVTVLTSPTARILDVLTLIKSPDPESGEQELLALTLPGRAKTTAAYLKGKIFFMDHVTVNDVSEAYGQAEVFGPGVDALFVSLGFSDPAELPDVRSTADQGGTHLLRQQQLPPRLLMRKTQETVTLSKIQAWGGHKLSTREFEIARIEAGWPGPLTELTEAYTPLENNMNWAVSTTKGCYTGQEVIARQITYDKITRKLVGLQLEAEVAAGSKVWAEGQAAGSVTSTALSGMYGPIALAMIKRPHFETGTQVNVGEPGSGVPGVIVNLPFYKEGIG